MKTPSNISVEDFKNLPYIISYETENNDIFIDKTYLSLKNKCFEDYRSWIFDQDNLLTNHLRCFYMNSVNEIPELLNMINIIRISSNEFYYDSSSSRSYYHISSNVKIYKFSGLIAWKQNSKFKDVF